MKQDRCDALGKEYCPATCKIETKAGGVDCRLLCMQPSKIRFILLGCFPPSGHLCAIDGIPHVPNPELPCVDLELFDVKGKERTCQWITRRKKRCQKYGVLFCPLACGNDLCPDLSDGEGEGRLEVTQAKSLITTSSAGFCTPDPNITSSPSPSPTAAECLDQSGEFLIKGRPRNWYDVFFILVLAPTLWQSHAHGEPCSSIWTNAPSSSSSSSCPIALAVSVAHGFPQEISVVARTAKFALPPAGFATKPRHSQLLRPFEYQ